MGHLQVGAAGCTATGWAMGSTADCTVGGVGVGIVVDSGRGGFCG